MPFSSVFFWNAFLAWAIAVWILRSVQLLKSLKFMPRVFPIHVPRSVPERVTVLIPMKNEASNARECYERFKAQDYPDLEILIINDNSSDDTEKILKSLGAHYINNPPTPSGWTGKNFALANGVKSATGEWLLFTDADTRHEKTSVTSAIAHMKERKLELLTLLPRCLTGTFLEHLIQPPAMAMLGLWFPIQRINDSADPLYFANGQYLLIKRELYEKIGGHEAVRGAFLEDFALMKEAKKRQAKVECALGRDIYGTRMYESWDAIWRGWRRIYLHAFEQNPATLLKNAAAVFLFSFVPFAALLCASGLAFWIAAALCLYIVGVSWKGYSIVDAKSEYALLHPFSCFVLVLILLDAFWIALTKGKTVWR